MKVLFILLPAILWTGCAPIIDARRTQAATSAAHYPATVAGPDGQPLTVMPPSGGLATAVKPDGSHSAAIVDGSGTIIAIP